MDVKDEIIARQQAEIDRLEDRLRVTHRQLHQVFDAIQEAERLKLWLILTRGGTDADRVAQLRGL